MKLSEIKKEHIQQAVWQIDKNEIPESYKRSIYWVSVGDKKYPFKYLVRVAYQQIKGNENEWLEFYSKKIYRDYVESLGFNITSNNKFPLFFTSNDILELSKIAGITYDINNFQHKLIAENLKNNVWNKTQFWFNQIINELEGFNGQCVKKWGQRGWDNHKKVSSFKTYTWARIFRINEEKKDIYFTIGVDGNKQALVYKLDYQFQGKTVLTSKQKELCHNMIKTSPACWKEIKLADLPNYNWDKLIEETIDFINQYTDLYDKTLEEVWSINQKRISRLAYNNSGWVMPSGLYGKSKHPDTHEARHGYGHEEWLFDTSKLIDGYHYAFLEPIRKQQSAFIGKKYDVWLYTIDSVTKKRFWIGEIDNVEVIDSKEADKIKQQYIYKNWFKEMESQILACGANPKGFSDWKGVDLFNIRFLPKDARINDPYIEIPEKNPLNEQSRYAFAFFREEFNLELENEEEKTFSFISSKPSSSKTGNIGVKKGTYYREPKPVEITYLHKSISEELTNLLREQYGYENVTPEHPAGYDSNRIDIVVNDKDGLVFYEIKTYSNLRTSIREAFGQLIEYTSWTNHSKAKEIIIITQTPSEYELKKAKTYFEHIRTLFNIPIYYQSFDTETKKLSDKI